MRQKIDQFEEIYKHINNLVTDDAIIATMKLKEILKIFTKNIMDEKTLSDLFDFLNTKALQDDGFITKFVQVLCSRQIESFSINGKIARHATLEILQKNFQSADHFKRDDVNKFYNSIKLLGEYFNKARIANGSPINILGQSLLNLINVELEKELKNPFHFKNDDDLFSELVLTQMALNGNLLKNRHKTEIESVLISIRKCLIQQTLTPKTKAFLIMTLDLYYCNFNESHLEKSIEKVYEPYLLDSHTDRINSMTTKKPDEPEKVIKTNKINGNSGHQQQQQPTTSSQKLNDRRSERPPSVSRSSVPPTRTIRPPLRKSEPLPHNHHNHQQQQQPKSPQKKISPKELRTRTNITNKTSPRTDSKVSRALNKVESAIDKLQIKSSKNSSNDHNNTVTTESVPQSTTNDENILKQQNSNGNPPNKVYFKEENVENLSWVENLPWDSEVYEEDPKNIQYSNSFINFLSNN